MNPGFAKIVHHPVVRMSSAGRNEEMKSPKVGIVQSTAMMSDAIVAVREVSCFLTRIVFGLRVRGLLGGLEGAEVLADGKVGRGDAAHRISLCLRSTLTL